MTFEVRGYEDFAKLAAALHEEAHGGLEHRVGTALRVALDPPRIVREGAEDLPQGGGLRARVERYPAHEVPMQDGVSLRIDRAAGYNAGRLRHPVYGNEDVIVSQQVPAHGFDRAFDHAAERAKVAAEVAMQDSLKTIARKV